MTLLAAYVARFVLAAWLSRRARALAPIAAASAAEAILAALTWGPLPVQAGVAVAWPGVALWLAAWGLERQKGPAVPRRASPGEGRPTSSAPFYPDGFRRSRPATSLPHALALVYALAGAVAAACYAHAHGVYVVALFASRWSAVLAIVAMLWRQRPRSPLALACVVPAIGLACGVVAGAWPLAQAGGVAAIARGWGLARAETWIALGAQCAAMVWAARENRQDDRK